MTVVARLLSRKSIGTAIRGSRVRAPVWLYIFLTLWHWMAQCSSRTASISMEGYENKSLSRLGEDLDIRDESQKKQGKMR